MTAISQNDYQNQEDSASAQRTLLTPKSAADRSNTQKNMIDMVLQPYTLISLVLLSSALAISFIDPKGLMLLLVAAVIVLFIRLGYTRRALLQEGNELQRRTIALLREQNVLLHQLSRHGGEGEQ